MVPQLTKTYDEKIGQFTSLNAFIILTIPVGSRLAAILTAASKFALSAA